MLVEEDLVVCLLDAPFEIIFHRVSLVKRTETWCHNDIVESSFVLKEIQIWLILGVQGKCSFPLIVSKFQFERYLSFFKLFFCCFNYNITELISF